MKLDLEVFGGNVSGGKKAPGGMADARAQSVVLFAAGVPVLSAVNLLLLVPAAHSAHAGAFTQALPWVVMAFMLVLFITAGALLSSRLNSRAGR